MAVICDLILICRQLQPIILRAIPAQPNGLIIHAILLDGEIKESFLRFVFLCVIQIPDQLQELQLGIPLLGDLGTGGFQPHGIGRGQINRRPRGVRRFSCAVLVLFVFVNVVVQVLMSICKSGINTTGILHDIRHVRNTVPVIQYGCTVGSIYGLLRALAPGISFNLVVQVGHIVVGILIRPHDKADGVGRAVLQHAQRRKIPCQFTAGRHCRHRHQVGIIACSIDRRGRRRGRDGVRTLVDLVVSYSSRRTVRSGPVNGVHRRAVAAHRDGVARGRAARLGILDAADRAAADGRRQSGMGDIRRDTVLEAHARQAQRVVDVIDDDIERIGQSAGIGGIEEIIVVGIGVAKVALGIRSLAVRRSRQVVQIVNKRAVGAIRKYGIELVSCLDDRRGLRIRVAPMPPVSGITGSICSVAMTGRRLAVRQENDIDLIVGLVLFPGICQRQRMPQAVIPVGSIMMIIIVNDGHDRRIVGAVNNVGNRIIVCSQTGRTKVIACDGDLDHIAEVRITRCIVAQQALDNPIQRQLLGIQTGHLLINCAVVNRAVVIVACTPRAVTIVHP